MPDKKQDKFSIEYLLAEIHKHKDPNKFAQKHLKGISDSELNKINEALYTKQLQDKNTKLQNFLNGIALIRAERLKPGKAIVISSEEKRNFEKNLADLQKRSSHLKDDLSKISKKELEDFIALQEKVEKNYSEFQKREGFEEGYFSKLNPNQILHTAKEKHPRIEVELRKRYAQEHRELETKLASSAPAPAAKNKDSLIENFNSELKKLNDMVSAFKKCNFWHKTRKAELHLAINKQIGVVTESMSQYHHLCHKEREMSSTMAYMATIKESFLPIIKSHYEQRSDFLGTLIKISPERGKNLKTNLSSIIPPEAEIKSEMQQEKSRSRKLNK